MNKIVRDHYPVSKLPHELREAVGNVVSVRLTLEPVDQSSSNCTRAALECAKSLRRSGKIRAVTSQEAVTRIRELRDEWDS
ncbi:hypothetical protein LJR009_002841 [Bosea sp. LjRoot9]|uniref:hypothetical protein n=1 Tax=Bosea sp. LjRoot9 TaxID=3342341 RepID=UPI003ECE5E49